jgi:hypothetical protein
MKRVEHKWPEQQHHLHFVVIVLNGLAKLSDEKKFRVCEVYVQDHLPEGLRISVEEGKEKLELFVEEIAQRTFSAEFNPPKQGEPFFLWRLFRRIYFRRKVDPP